MLDLSTEQGRVVAAALALASEKPWERVTFAEIAERAGTTLAAMREHFGSKGAVLVAFSRLVDGEMLRRAPKRAEGQMARDALFEVIMSRFDVLEPYKGSLKSIAASGLPDPVQIFPMLATQRWMLEAAGVDSGSWEGQLRAAGLAGVYASVFRVWLADDDPGLAKTMAALDRRLRRGQRTLEQVEELCGGISRVASAIADVVRGAAARRTAGSDRSSGRSSGAASPPDQPQG